jgi:cysteine desulfurase
VDQFGLVNPDDIRTAITDDTLLISVMAANNEIGTIAPIAEIGRIAHEREVLFHTDATQAVGYVNIDVDAMGIDLLSLSAHKIYGPQGVGALFVRKRRPRVRLQPQVHGGGHQRGIRSGTLNLPGIVGFGKAAELARKERDVESHRVAALRDRLLEALKAELDSVELNGHSSQRLPNNLSVALAGIESRSLLVQLKHDVALSTGSACTTAKVEPSHVILALGFGDTRAHQSVRFGLGRENTETDVDFVVAKLGAGVRRLRQFAFA